MAHCVDSTWILKSCYPRNGAGSRQSFVTLVPIVSLPSDTQIVCEKLSLVQLEKPPVRLRCRESLARKLTRWKISPVFNSLLTQWNHPVSTACSSV